MKNGNNTVVLETKEEKAKRKILEVIEECTELTILLNEEPLRMIVSLDNDIMTNIIKMLIMEDLFNAVTIQPYSKAKGQQIAPEITKKQQSAETSTQEPMKKADKKQTIKDRILLFMKQEARVVLSNAEINAAVGSNITPQNLSRNLVLLCEEGKIEKVSRGYWKAKEEITEQQVLNLFTTGWQMTQEEVTKKLKAESEAVVEVLNILVGSKKLQKEGEVYKIYKSPFGIFEDETYKVLLDYIMEQSHFVEASVKNKFPQEAHKLEELLKQMGQKYIKEQQDAKGSYDVYLKGRILYYVMQHPNANLGDIRHAFPSISNQEMSNVINIALRNKELQRNATTGTFVTVAM